MTPAGTLRVVMTISLKDSPQCHTIAKAQVFSVRGHVHYRVQPSLSLKKKTVF